jgi:hypothetical protein
MENFTLEAAVIALQLQQMLMELGYELDLNSGRKIGDFYTEDGAFLCSSCAYRGRDSIVEFHRDHLMRVRGTHKDGVRTTRHTFTNLRFDIQDNNHWSVYFISAYYAGEGTPPVPKLAGPTTVSDCRMFCRREADGKWRIAEFGVTPIFLGSDSSRTAR